MYTGGRRILGVEWHGSTAIAVRFEASDDGLQTQLYAGRTLIGTTAHPADRMVIGQLEESEWPQYLALTAVDTADLDTDFGALLPVRPYNRARIVVVAAALPADAQRLELTGGLAPGGAVQASPILDVAILEGDGEYELISPPMPGSGDWNFEVTPYDSRLDDGNAGTPLAVTVPIIAMPPDVQRGPSDERLQNLSVASQSLAVSVVLPLLLWLLLALPASAQSITQGRPPQPLAQWYASTIITPKIHCDLTLSGSGCNLSVKPATGSTWLPVSAATQPSNGVCDHSAVNEAVCRGFLDGFTAPVQHGGSFPKADGSTYQLQQGQVLRLVRGPGNRVEAHSQGFHADSTIYRSLGPLVEFRTVTTWTDARIDWTTEIHRTTAAPQWTCSSFNVVWAGYSLAAVNALKVDGQTYPLAQLPVNVHQNFAISGTMYELALTNGQTLRVGWSAPAGPCAIKFWNDGQRLLVTIIRDNCPLTISQPVTVTSYLEVLP